MKSHPPLWGFIVFSVITVCASRELNSEDKEFLQDKIEEWEDAPVPEKIVGGTLLEKKGTKKYTFKYVSDNGEDCSAQMISRKDGSGSHKWECVGKVDPPDDSDATTEDYDVSDMERRKMKSGKKTKLKGQGIDRRKLNGAKPNKEGPELCKPTTDKKRTKQSKKRTKPNKKVTKPNKKGMPNKKGKPNKKGTKQSKKSHKGKSNKKKIKQKTG